MNFLHQSTGSTPCSPNTPWAPLPPQHHCTIADSQVCLFHLSFQGPTEGPTLPGSLTKGTLALGSGCFPWGLAALSALLPHSFLNFYSLSWLLFHPPFPSRYCRPLCTHHLASRHAICPIAHPFYRKFYLAYWTTIALRPAIGLYLVCAPQDAAQSKSRCCFWGSSMLLLTPSTSSATAF